MEFSVGDRVVIAGSHRLAGTVGRVDRVDEFDPEEPYRVVDGDGVFIAWARELTRIADLSSERESLVTRAKELLAGTHYDASDLIRMAEFLAGEQ